MDRREANAARFSIPSIIAIIAAILSFTTGAFWGFVLALVAIFFGAIGIMFALAPGVRGGIMSILSLVAGGIALIVAVIKAIAWLV